MIRLKQKSGPGRFVVEVLFKLYKTKVFTEAGGKWRRSPGSPPFCRDALAGVFCEKGAKMNRPQLRRFPVH